MSIFNVLTTGEIMEYNIKFTEQELDIIFKCMSEQPYKLVAQTIDKIRAEIKKQIEAGLVDKTE